jgi:heterodisulfide reductase subunit C
LRQVVLSAAGQDVRQCRQCALCDARLDEAQDLSVPTLVQLVLLNDEEALTSRTLWSETVLAGARQLCAKNLKLDLILLALRDEARRRGLDAPA